MREGLKDRPLAALLLARVMERMALQEGDLERLRLAREHKARAQQRLLESQNSVQTSTKLPDPERFDEPSPGRLFIDDFLDKNLVEFDECSAHYESMTPVELVDEMTFLFGRQTLAIRFELSSKRYYAFLDSLVHCAANNRDLTNHQRSQLVNMAIDVRAYVRNRTAEDWREAFDKALSAFGEQLKMRWLSGKHEPSYIKAQGNLGEMTKSHLYKVLKRWILWEVAFPIAAIWAAFHWNYDSLGLGLAGIYLVATTVFIGIWLVGRLKGKVHPRKRVFRLWYQMYEVWRRLEGPVVNPSLVREAMINSTNQGAVWDAVSWSLIDRVIATDSAVWVIQPNGN